MRELLQESQGITVNLATRPGRWITTEGGSAICCDQYGSFICMAYNSQCTIALLYQQQLSLASDKEFFTGSDVERTCCNKPF